MRKLFLFGLVLFSINNISAELNQSDVAALNAFFVQESNYEALGLENSEALDTYVWNTPQNGLTWSSDRLTKFELNNKQLKGVLDVTSLSELTTLLCDSNEITSIKSNNLTQLTRLSCVGLASVSGRHLEELEVIGCTNLKTLDCYYNKLTVLDLDGLISLTDLSCHYNKIVALDFYKAVNLQHIYCGYNELTEINVQTLFSLQVLSALNNENLTTLNMSNNMALKELRFGNNKLTSLALGFTPHLETLSCYNNDITELNLQVCPNLKTVLCYGNNLTELDASNLTQLDDLKCYGNNLTFLNVNGSTAITTLDCHDNNLLFTTLPLGPYNSYKYQNQAKIEKSQLYNSIDLSEQYNAAAGTTIYNWGAVSATDLGNGFFAVAQSFSGQIITCELTNNKFPDLTLIYDIEITGGTTVGLVNKQLAEKPIVSFENNSLIIDTPQEEHITVFSANGAKINSFIKPIGRLTIDGSSYSNGLFIVKGSSAWAGKFTK